MNRTRGPVPRTGNPLNHKRVVQGLNGIRVRRLQVLIAKASCGLGDGSPGFDY